MRKEIEKYELIEQYLNNLLSANERSEIDARIKSDPGFAHEVEQQRKVQNLITEKSFLAIREELGKIHSNYQGTKTSFKGKGRGWQWGLSGITIAIIISLVFFINKSYDIKENPNEIIPTIADSDKDSTIQSKKQIEKNIHTQVQNTKIDITTHPQIQNQSNKNLETFEIDTVKQQANSKVEPVVSNNKENLTENNPLIPNKESDIENTIIPEEVDNNKNEQTSELNKKDCDDVVITSDIDIEKSCSDKPTGKIKIKSETIKGGNAPYLVSINNSEYYTQFIFEKLRMGNYIISIKDNDDCRSLLGNYFIESIDCSYEFAFAPDKGELWKIPVQTSPAEIKILNKNGQLVFAQLLEPDVEYEWNGRTQNGDELPMGAYIFFIETGNNEPFHGTVTIIR